MNRGSRPPEARSRRSSGRPGSRLFPRLGSLLEEIDERIARLPTRINEYGYDPFGLDPRYARRLILLMAFFHRYWFRVETRGLENLPEGRVLLIANHAGNTFAWDAAMLATSLFLEAEPPRILRGMGEYYLPTIPFFSVFMHRLGSVVGTPSNCARLLEHEEAIMVFPEGQRGFVKTWRQRYELQEFGLGFLRLALETGTPIVPVGIVGGEEHSPGIANVRPIGKLIGAPAFPVTLTFPLLGPAGYVPFPVKFRIRLGKPMRFEGDPAEEDARVEEKVEAVKEAIRELIRQGRAARRSWFT